MGREVGGGFRMGNTCTPVTDSCLCMAKPIQYCKVKKIIKNSLKKERKKCSGRKNKTTFCILKKTGGNFSSLWPTLINPCMPIVQVGSLEYEDNAASGLCLTMHFFFPKLGIATHFHGYGICLESFYSRKQQVDFCYFPGLK